MAKEVEKKASFQEIQHSLLQKGRKKGLLTYKEIIDALQEYNLDTEAIDEFYEELSRQGIEVLDELAEETIDAEIVEKENYDEIKRFTEYYMFDNKKFDKSDLFNELNSSGLIELEKEDELFSAESENMDADFDISEKALNNKYKRTISTSDEITITTKNYLESLRDNELNFDEKNKKITIMIDDDYLTNVKEELGGE